MYALFDFLIIRPVIEIIVAEYGKVSTGQSKDPEDLMQLFANM